jgi:hypothetical protein
VLDCASFHKLKIDKELDLIVSKIAVCGLNPTSSIFETNPRLSMCVSF